jgi:hypothetical protein
MWKCDIDKQEVNLNLAHIVELKHALEEENM